MRHARIDDARALDAAAWLATVYNHGRLSLTRQGDDMEVIGTNGYSLLRVLAPATFEGWEDGESHALGGLYRLKAVRRVARGKNLASVYVDVDEDGGNDVLTFKRMVREAVWYEAALDAMEKRPDVERLELHEAEAATTLDLRPERMIEIGQLVHMLGSNKHWTVCSRGSKRPLRITERDGRVTIYTMPLTYAGSE